MRRVLPRARPWMILVLGLGLAGAFPLRARPQSDKPPKEEKDWKPAYVPADALKFGATLEEKASPEFKGWVHEHVAKHMREQPVNPRTAMQAVDDRYPQTSDIARDAGTFLLQYLAYKDEETNERMLAARIREIDRQTYDLSREINIMAENEQRRLMPTNPRAAISAEQRVRMDEEIRKREEKIRQLGTERQLKATELAASRKKVNLYLKVLGVVFDRMKDVPADSIAELK